MSEAEQFIPEQINVGTASPGDCVEVVGPMDYTKDDVTAAPPDLLAEMEREMEAAKKEAAEGGTLPDKPYASVPEALGPGGSLPVSDLAQRLKLLADAWVEVYEDGPLRIRFDIEGRRAHVNRTQGTPGSDTPQW